LKSEFIKTHLIYFLTFLFCFIISCNHNNSNKQQNPIIENDNISILINKAKNNKTNIKERKSSLYKAYDLNSNQQNDSIKTRNLLKITSQAYKLNDTVFFKKSNKQAYELAYQLKDFKNIAKTHWNLGYHFTKREVLDSSYYHYYQAYNYYRIIKNENNAAKMLFGMAFSQGRLKDYVGSETSLFNAISILKPLNDFKLLYKCHNFIGSIYKDIGEYERSILFHKKALINLKHVKNKKTYREGVYNNIALIYQKQGNYIDAIANFNIALSNDSLFYKNINLYARLKDNLAYTRLLNGDTLYVKEALLHSLKIRDSVKNISGVVINSLHMAEYYLKTKDTITALHYAKTANKLATNITTNNRDILASLQLLSTIDPENSKQYFNEHSVLSEQLEQKERKLRNKFARIRFETDEKIEEVNELSLQRTLIITASVALITIILLLYFIRHQRGKHRELKLKTEQQQANEEIYKLMLKQQTKLEEGRVKERHRISEELHDGVLGKIFYTRLGLGFLGTEVSDKAIAKHKEYIHELHEIEKEIRAISHELKYELLAPEANYIQLIDYLASTQSSVGAFEYHIEQDDTMYWSAISDVVKINLYRIVQEAFQNINKHAKASTVHISFSLKDDILGLAIHDNGIGYDSTEKANGIGLENISSRVKKLNGTFAIESNPNKGTHLTIRIPIALDEVPDGTNT